MKTLKLIPIILTILLVTTSSCKRDEIITPSLNHDEIIKRLTNVSSNTLNFSVNSLKRNTEVYKNKLTFDQSMNFRQNIFHVNEVLLGSNKLHDNIIELAIEEYEKNLKVSNNNIQHDIDILYQYLDYEQIVLLQPLLNILAQNERIEYIYSETEKFNVEVINSSLSYEQQLELFSISSSIFGAIDFINNGGIELIANEIGVDYSGGISIQGCKVNVGGVLSGSVLSGFASGAFTAKAAAAAGTVGIPVPVLGTITGAVSGFMVGFAGGFVSGVITGTVGSLLNTCFK